VPRTRGRGGGGERRRGSFRSHRRVEDGDAVELIDPCGEDAEGGPVELETGGAFGPAAELCCLFAFDFEGGFRFGAHCLPAALEGLHDDGLDEEEDIVGAGVVGTDEGALGGVEGALEEGAEDSGLDVGPVVAGGGGEDGEVLDVEVDDGIAVEEAAVEVTDAVRAKDAVFL